MWTPAYGIVAALGVASVAAAQDAAVPVVLLWPNGAPGSDGKTSPEKVENGRVTSVHQPSLTLYLPAKAKATGAAVVVIPGGGHRMLAIDHEGHAVGRWLSERGIAGFVLKYRLAREEGSTYTIEGHALPDTQRAVRLVRSRAAEWGVDPARVGVLGFSAGGELAQQVSQRPADGTANAADWSSSDRRPRRFGRTAGGNPCGARAVSVPPNTAAAIAPTPNPSGRRSPACPAS